MAQQTGKPTETVTPDPNGSEAPPVTDAADTSPRGPAPDTSGKRVRAVPYQKGSTVRVREATFREHGIEHPTVVWDYRKDNFTVAVGTQDGQISEDAANFLTRKFKETFEFLDQ